MTKIDIFSGFLGAGKTTLIKKLIAEAYTGEKIVLIENEFGEIAIDGGFLKDSGVQINEMNSGCICCSLVGDFADALQKVLEQFHPDRILIEPSGVGKLSDVIRAVQGVQSDELVLNGFTTVVDANKCKMYMKNFGEFFNNQVENASAIILSRTEGIRPEKLDAAVALLREKNPTATIVTTPWTELDGKQILETMERRDTLSAELEHLKAEAAEEDDEDEHEHHHHHHDDDDELGTLELVHHELAHVRVVAQKRRRVAKQELLRDRPALRQVAVERVEHPHAVELHKHTLGADLVLQRLQVFDREVGLLVNVAHKDVAGAELVRLIDLLALFAQQQQRALALVEAAVLERLLDEFRLAGFQKAGEQVYRQIRCLLFRVSQCGTAPSVHPRPGATRSRTRGR